MYSLNSDYECCGLKTKFDGSKSRLDKLSKLFSNFYISLLNRKCVVIKIFLQGVKLKKYGIQDTFFTLQVVFH